MNVWKKLLLSVSAICMLVVMTSCDSKKDNTSKQPEEPAVAMVANDRYVEPLNPTQEQIKAYNQLSDAITKGNKEEEAKQVAVSFAYDFFMVSNKKDQTDIGGLQYIPSNMVGKFQQFADAYYYSNYATIVNEFGKEALPQITSVKVDSSQVSTFMYGENTVEGYLVKLTIQYKETDLKKEKLKTTASVQVVDMQDYDYERGKDYVKGFIQSGEMKQAYRIIAVE